MFLLRRVIMLALCMVWCLIFPMAYGQSWGDLVKKTKEKVKKSATDAISPTKTPVSNSSANPVPGGGSPTSAAPSKINSQIPGQRAAVGNLSQIFNTEVEGSLLGKGYRSELIVIKFRPGLITDAVAADMAKAQFPVEDSARSDNANKALHSRGWPILLFDWWDLQKKNSSEANGAALDFYLRPDANPAILRDIPGWDDSLTQAWINFVSLPPSNGRELAFAALDAAPAMKQQLLAAANRESVNLFYPVDANGHYDLTTQSINFTAQDLIEAGAGKPGDSVARYNLVKLEYSLPGEVQRRYGAIRSDFNEISHWRQLTGCNCQPVEMQLDRQLRLRPISVDLKTAEALKLGGKAIHARLFVTYSGVGQALDPNQLALIGRVTKIELLNYEGTLIATIPGSDLPSPASVQTSQKSMPTGAPRPAAFPDGKPRR